MRFDDRPQLPLTRVRAMLLAWGLALFALGLGAAVALAPQITGPGHGDAAVLFAVWGASVPWAVVTVLLIVRQADLPDIATASFLVTISAFAAFALTAALNTRGTDHEVNVVDTLFLGVTTGALSALIVWAVAIAIARLLRLPTTEAIRARD
ncbi:MAG TPA: hypothetical protein VEZ14_08965 [Dehalococcoidia bacterium]|nr:hypothetical protein [Dehalococcoidia bacterium]